MKNFSFAPVSLWSVFINVMKADIEGFKQRNLTTLFTIITIVVSMYLTWTLLEVYSGKEIFYNTISRDPVGFLLPWMVIYCPFVMITFYVAILKNRGVGWQIFFYFIAFILNVFMLSSWRYPPGALLMFFYSISLFMGMVIADIMKSRNQLFFGFPCY